MGDVYTTLVQSFLKGQSAACDSAQLCNDVGTHRELRFVPVAKGSKNHHLLENVYLPLSANPGSFAHIGRHAHALRGYTINEGRETGLH